MKKTWGRAEFTSALTNDNEEGWTALVLYRHSGGTTEQVARVVFWDAEGQFSLELSASELPLSVVEELIAEAKAEIKLG